MLYANLFPSSLLTIAHKKFIPLNIKNSVLPKFFSNLTGNIKSNLSSESRFFMSCIWIITSYFKDTFYALEQTCSQKLILLLIFFWCPDLSRSCISSDNSKILRHFFSWSACFEIYIQIVCVHLFGF